MFARVIAPLVVAAALFTPHAAQAAAFGTSVGLGSGAGVFGGGPFGPRLSTAFASRGFVPSLDVRFEPVHLQFHVLEFLDHLSNDGDLFLGANGYYEVHRAGLADSWSGVVQPGLSLDIISAGGGTVFALAGECRLGMEAASSAGFGVYLVPAIGFVVGDGTSELLLGGGMQFSVWFGN